MDFFLWRSDRGDDFCVVEEPEIEDSWELSDGVPRLATMDGPFACSMNPSFRNEIRLSDNLYGASVPIISRRAKEILEAAPHNRIEFLPVAITNHKKRVEPEEYFVLHPLDVVDCIDTEASGVEWNRIAPDQISRCKSLVLKNDAIPETYTIFRPQGWGDNILVRKDLVDTLQGAGLAGLYFRPVQGYTGIG